MIDELTECYRLLDLAPGASRDEVKRSYRELVKVWHPDRFSEDPKLQAKAQEKLKQINSAYERVCKAQAYGPQRSSSRAGSNTSQAGDQSWTTPGGGAKSNPDSTRHKAPRQTPPPSSPPTPARTTEWGRKAAILAIAVVIITVFKTITATNDRSIPDKTDSPSYSAPNRRYSSAEAPAEETQEGVEDYNDFSNPTNVLRTPTWLAAAPEVRPHLVDRAMNAFLKGLKAKKDKIYDGQKVWTPAGTLTDKGEEYVAKARQLFQKAAQDPEGGMYMDSYKGSWETLWWVDEFMLKGNGPEPDPTGAQLSR